MSTKTIAAIVVLLAVGTAGCTSQKAQKPATGESSELKFSQCMRDQGLSWFPDPGSDGGLKISVPPTTDQGTYDKAEQACKAYAPGSGQKGTISAEDLNKLRQMAQCIRDHGFSKYPDPDANGGTHFDSKAVGVEPDDPAFAKARQDCQKYLPPRKSGS